MPCLRYTCLADDDADASYDINEDAGEDANADADPDGGADVYSHPDAAYYSPAPSSSASPPPSSQKVSFQPEKLTQVQVRLIEAEFGHKFAFSENRGR